VEEIEKAYIESWRLGAKAISIYRDGSKRTQPLNTSKAQVADTRNAESNVASGFSRTEPSVAASGFSRTEPSVVASGFSRTDTDVREVVKEVVKIVERPQRRKLPDERQAITHKFDVAGHEGYITVGLFEDGTPGEIFLVMAKEGSTISGFADAFAQAISYALQYGVPLQTLVDKFSHSRFEPSGMTKNPEVRFAKSIVDYIFRWMATKFLSRDVQYHVGVNVREETETGVRDSGSGSPAVARSPEAGPRESAASDASAKSRSSEFAAMRNQEDAPPCSTCGSIMIRSGSCYKCANCGTTSGCA
jgi:ribonucleoside-diphosphate reductase alpha chain